MSRKSQIADAAIATLADAGMRGLTHRAVDRAANLPEGSTSYYFRTRAALLQAAVARLAEVDSVELPAVRVPDMDALCRAAAELLHRWMTTDRGRHLARYELTLEATRRPELMATLLATGSQVRTVVADGLRVMGVHEPERKAADVAALFDGLLFDRIVGYRSGDHDLDGLTDTVRAILMAVAR